MQSDPCGVDRDRAFGAGETYASQPSINDHPYSSGDVHLFSSMDHMDSPAFTEVASSNILGVVRTYGQELGTTDRLFAVTADF